MCRVIVVQVSPPVDLIPSGVKAYAIYDYSGPNKIGTEPKFLGRETDPREEIKAAKYNCGAFSLSGPNSHPTKKVREALFSRGLLQINS